MDRFNVLEKLHAATQVDGRYLALPIEDYPPATWGEANNRWIEATLELGEKAVCAAMTKAGRRPLQLARSSSYRSQAYASPSIEARLINKMGLRART